MKDKPLSEKAIFIDGEYMQFDRDVKKAVEKLKESQQGIFETHIRYGKNTTETEMRFVDMIDEIDKIFGRFE